MRTIIIDITCFDQDEATKGTRVVYGFRQRHLENADETIKAFVANPVAFKEGQYIIILTQGQNGRFLAYLKAGNYRRTNFAHEETPEYLLAFSYGENPDVNMRLSTVVEGAIKNIDSLKVFAQWEIANILYERNTGYISTVDRIDLDYDRDYITSMEVVEKFKRLIGEKKDPRVFVVCQAWHAPRCIQICTDQGLKVVRGEFVDEFSRSDPQKWVRNWLAWVIKEGTKK